MKNKGSEVPFGRAVDVSKAVAFDILRRRYKEIANAEDGRSSVQKTAYTAKTVYHYMGQVLAEVVEQVAESVANED